MRELVEFKFNSKSNLDGEINIIDFIAKGYRSENIWYFKNENEYKFFINDDLEVRVNDSVYKFNLNKKTEALIKLDQYLYKASITTNKLLINENRIEINYSMDFSGFSGVYEIIVELC